jgi:RsiW-degrading membrane proteinase PrsW (M82 family)
VTPWEQRLFERTRSKPFLWKTSLGIIAAGLLGAWLLQFASPSQAFTLADTEWGAGMPHGTLSELSRKGLELPDALDSLEWIYEEDQEADETVLKAIDRSDLYDDDKKLAVLYWQSLIHEKPEPALVTLSGTEPRILYSSYTLGRYLEYSGHLDQAVLLYEREGRIKDGSDGRYAAIGSYLDLNRLEDVRRLGADPLYADAYDNGVRYELAVREGNWRQAWDLILPSQYEYLNPSYLALAVCLGFIWLVIWLQMTRIAWPLGGRMTLCLLALLMGGLSTIPVVFLASWQEALWPWGASGDITSGLLDCVAGVGLREETLKFLFFIPFVPLLLWRGDELEMIMVAGCVGLGFAAEENILYLQDSANLGAAGRFLTANFFHMALTGMIGLAFCRAFRHGLRGWSEFLGTFALVVVMHGLYDAFLDLKQLEKMWLLYGLVFIGVCFRLFHALHKLCEPRRDPVSLTATFVWGLSLMVAISLCFAGYENGFDAAVMGVGGDAISLGIVVYLFVREFGDV